MVVTTLFERELSREKVSVGSSCRCENHRPRVSLYWRLIYLAKLTFGASTRCALRSKRSMTNCGGLNTTYTSGHSFKFFSARTVKSISLIRIPNSWNLRMSVTVASLPL